MCIKLQLRKYNNNTKFFDYRMAWSRYEKLLALVMVMTGSINTLSTNWANQIKSAGSDGQVRVFNHPFLQVHMPK